MGKLWDATAEERTSDIERDRTPHRVDYNRSDRIQLDSSSISSVVDIEEQKKSPGLAKCLTDDDGWSVLPPKFLILNLY